jgi:hypothetical protein
MTETKRNKTEGKHIEWKEELWNAIEHERGENP